VRNLAAAGIAAVVVIAAGCGDGGSAPLPPVKTTVVEVPTGGFRIAVPEGWERELLPLTDKHRRWFVGRWKPANVALPVEALLVHILAPGCPASEMGSRFADAPIASEPDPKDYSVVSSGSGVIRGRAAFRIEVKYKSVRYGELFEASVYLETGEGSGLLVTSRGSVKSDALVRARLEAALLGLEPVKRVVVAGAPRRHAGGIEIGFPEGFDEYYGPSAAGTTAYALGDGDIKGRQETIALIIGPPIPAGEKFVVGILSEASKNMKAGESRKVTIAGHEVDLFPFRPSDPAAGGEVVAATFRLGSQPAALLVIAAAIPPGRALEVFEKTAATIRFKEEPFPSLRPVTFGDGGSRSSLAPEGWTTLTEGPELTTFMEETVPSPDGGEPKKRQAAVLWASMEDDFRKDGSPMGAAKEQAAALAAKKSSASAPEEVVLPDGRKAARLVAATPISYEIFLYARTGPGAIAQVHLSALPSLASEGLKAATEMIGATRFTPFAEVRRPDAAVVERSGKELPALIERARRRAAAESWYIEELSGAEVGGQHVQVFAGGRWTDRERRPTRATTIASEMEGAPDLYVERVNLRVANKTPDPKAQFVEIKTETKIDASDAKQVFVTRQSNGDERKDRLDRPDVWLPPDLSASDGLVIALAGSPEGTYSFAAVQERFLSLTWREYRVKGEEDIEVPAGKFKARRVEAGASSVYWVADGRVVKAELGTFSRKLASREKAEAFLKE
jgi:hypothetical protein